MNMELSSTQDLSQGQLSLSNGSSFEYGMLLTPKSIVMSTPNSRSSPLFQNFQTDMQQSPIGSPCSPTKPNFKPVTKNRVLGFTESEAAQNTGFDIFGIGFGSEEHAGSERTFSSSSNSSHNSLLSDESFSHILRSIHEQGEVTQRSSIPIDVVNANHSPPTQSLQNGIQEEINPYMRIHRQDQSLTGHNGMVNPMLNTSFHDSDDGFRGLKSNRMNPAFLESSPIQQSDYCSSLLECLNLNGDILPTGIKPPTENERQLWEPPVPIVQALPPCIEAINAKLPSVFPTSHKDLIKLLVLLNDLQESIYSYEPYQRDLINDHVNNMKQRVLKELSSSTPSPSSTSPSSYNKNYNLNRFNDSFEAMKYPERIQPAPRYQREPLDSFDYSSRNQIAWQGSLPQRNHRNAVYSCKVFVGGVPWDITEQNLFHAFRQYNPVKVEWPIKDGHPSQSKGYAYVVFESEKQVKLLLQNCDYKFNNGGCWYHKVSSKKMKSKEAQIIPWAQWDTNFDRSPTPKLDPQQTIFVGALHGMINAEALALIMQELFQGVIYAGIDTDRYRYPIGSGRVAFNNTQSYMKAVAAQFVEIRTKKFCKKVQVDPYLEDATCSICQLQQGPYFCRDLKCFRYFCKTCFQYNHTAESLRSHQPLMRNSAKPLGTPGSYQPVCYNQQQPSQSEGGAYRGYSRQMPWPMPYNNGQHTSTNGGRNNFHFNGYNNGFESQIHNPAGYMSQSPSQYMR